MKKIIAFLITLVTIISLFSTTVSAASVGESLTRLGFSFMEEVLGDYTDSIKGIFNIILDVAEMCPTDTPEKEQPPKDDIQETPEIIVPPVTVRAGIFGYESTYVVYGETVPCHWIHTNDFVTMVEILSDVQSEEFLSMGQVAELFYEEFEHNVRISKRGTYIKAFFIEDMTDTSKKFLLPIKEEGLPVEVWEAFASEFEEEFICGEYFYSLLGVQMYFEDLLGYTPEVCFLHWGEAYGMLSINFEHIGKTYWIEAVYDEECNGCGVTGVELERFLNKYPECGAPKYDLLW